MLLPEEGEITHRAYYDSSELFSIIQKNLEQRVGITTQTVIGEARATLYKAIMRTLTEKLPQTEIDYKRRSIAWDYCDEKMKKLESYLWKEQILASQVIPFREKVEDMYDDLKQMRKERYQMKSEATERTNRVNKGFSKSYKSAQYEIYLHENLRKNYQLERLCLTPASPNDVWILAEAAALKHHSYKDTEMYLASIDSNNFCPATCEYGVSSAVTDQIFKELKIICDVPRKIANLLRGQ